METLKDLYTVLLRHRTLRSKIIARKAELENLDHDWGKNEDIKKLKLKEWETQFNKYQTLLEKYILYIHIHW